MTAMAQALKDAGIATPTVMNRIWSVIKDSNGIGSAEIKKKLSAVPEGTISSLLSQMEKRSMVYRRTTNTHSGVLRWYFTDLSTYSLLPLPSDLKTSPVKPKVVAVPATPQATPAPETTRDYWEKFVGNLSVAQAKELYAVLKGTFQ